MMTRTRRSRSKSPVPVRLPRAPAASERARSWWSLLAGLFLPVSYPKGLAPGYLTFQLYDTLQGLCSYLRGVLCTKVGGRMVFCASHTPTKAVLTGIGVGSETASATSATLNFIMRDGASMVGGLFLASAAANSFGQHIKAWRLFADVSNDVALTIELVAPAFAPSPVFVASLIVASVLKSWCGVAAGATRVAITQHFALYPQDMADIAAKEGSQETFVSLCGLMTGYYVAMIEDKATVWSLFALLTLAHVFLNFKAVSAVHLRTLSWARLAILAREFAASGAVLSFEDVSAREGLFTRGEVRVHFGLPPDRVDLYEDAHFPGVAWRRDSRAVVRAVVSPSADAVDVVALCAYVLVADEGRPLSVKRAKMLGELLKEKGWVVEASLLGDVQEKKVKFGT